MKKLKILIIVMLLGLLLVLGINYYVINKEKAKIYKSNGIKDNYDIALVLGCSVHKDGSPSLMLKDRLDMALELYKDAKVLKILVSGDHNDEYSEVNVMKNYLLEAGVVEDDILTDYKGFNTSKSIKNYAESYKDKKVILVTQQYHLYRSLYLSERYELKAIGTPAKIINYHGQVFREIREILARCKDFFIQ